jgi:hypothetical protein
VEDWKGDIQDDNEEVKDISARTRKISSQLRVEVRNVELFLGKNICK